MLWRRTRPAAVCWPASRSLACLARAQLGGLAPLSHVGALAQVKATGPRPPRARPQGAPNGEAIALHVLTDQLVQNGVGKRRPIFAAQDEALAPMSMYTASCSLLLPLP